MENQIKRARGFVWMTEIIKLSPEFIGGPFQRAGRVEDAALAVRGSLPCA